MTRFLIVRGSLEFEFEADDRGIAAVVAIQTSNGRLDVLDAETGEIVVPAFLELTSGAVRDWWWNNARAWAPVSVMKHRRGAVLHALRSMTPRGPADDLEAVELMERLARRIAVLESGAV